MGILDYLCLLTIISNNVVRILKWISSRFVSSILRGDLNTIHGKLGIRNGCELDTTSANPLLYM